MNTCHYCEESETEHKCPVCNELTCEDCFEPQTCMQSGWAMPCLGCSGRSEAARHEDPMSTAEFLTFLESRRQS